MSGLKLYELSSMLEQAYEAADAVIDQETGLMPDDWAKFLDDLEMAREEKALNIACLLKSIDAEAEALADEADNLKRRQHTLEVKYGRIKTWLSAFINPGEKIKDARAVIGWRGSTSVVIMDESALPDGAWKVSRSVSKAQIKEIIEKDGACPGAEIVKTNNLTIK